MKLIPLPAFNDNYIWLLHDARDALVVDPGDAAVVEQALAQRGLRLQTILVTHHHNDHSGGVAALREHWQPAIYGPVRDPMPEPITRVQGGAYLQALGLDWQVLDVPGHTHGHIAFFGQPTDQAPIVFCGDTLFSAGCGRLFEGTPEQMYTALQRLAALPDATRVCCAHEYTLGGLRFAQAVEPDNALIDIYRDECERLRAAGLPTLPSRIDLERALNPFLRVGVDAVQHAARSFDPAAQGEVEVFAALRAWKNLF
ncbi:MAG: hydroxyacylglutathione hydrolase [Rhodoferax sp.]